ncbi:MAG: DUF720 domain-containing protein [Victivallaceae bacterium]
MFVQFNNKKEKNSNIISSSIVVVPGAGGSNEASKKFGTALYTIFTLLLDAISTRQQTVLVQSKQLNANTNIQQELNDQISQIKYGVVNSGATEAEITQTQNANQNYSAQRSTIQDALITTRQNGQIILTNASTNINLIQQLASQDSAFLKTMSTIGSLANQINQPPG